MFSKWFLFCVDSEFNLLVYDVDALFNEASNQPLVKLNLFKNARLFNSQGLKQTPDHFGMSKEEINQEVLDKHLALMTKDLE